MKLDSQGKVLTLRKDAESSTRVQHHVLRALRNAPLVRDNLLKIQVGKTTRTEVEALLGPPEMEMQIEREKQNETRLQYFWHSWEKGRTYILVSYFSVVLDQDGVVKEVE